MFVVACFAWACGDSRAPPELLSGARDGVDHLFTVRTQPVLRFDAPISELQAQWIAGETAVPLDMSRDRLGATETVRLHLRRDGAERGVLRVRSNGREWNWSGLFVPTGPRHPSVADRPDAATVESRLQGAHPSDRPWLLAYKARRLRGVQAIALLESAADAALTLGWRSEAARLFQSSAHFARLTQRFARAERLLARALEAWPHPTIKAFEHRHRGLIARDQGRLLDARAHFETAVHALRAVGWREHAVQVDQNLEEMVLATGGRWRGLPPDPDSWIETSGREWLDYEAMRHCVRPPDWPTLRARMDVTIRRFAHNPAIGQAFRANFYVNRAFVRAAMGDDDGALKDIAAARAIDPAGGLQPDMLNRLAARLAPPAEGVQRLERLLADLLRKGYAVEVVRNTRVALAEALMAAGRFEEARTQWTLALNSLELIEPGLNLQRERSSFLALRAHIAASAVDFALRPGGAGVAEAFRIAEKHGAPVGHRLARVARLNEADPTQLAPMRAALTALRDLEKQLESAAESERPALLRRHDAAVEALRAAQQRVLDVVIGEPPPATASAILDALAPDEALLLFQPIRGADCAVRWRSFWLADGRVAVGPAEDDPFARWRSAAVDKAHVYVVGGAADDRHVFEGQIPGTVSRLPTASMLLAATRPADGPPVVVGDPRGDLGGADAEARWLAARGARALIGNAATRAAFDAATADARWVHYAGHGVSDSDVPFDAHLALADGPLPLTAILAMRRPARAVILAGCETARSAPLSHLESLGLADAFLFAGARTVVAADYTVPDDDARRFTTLFHLRDGPARPGAALREVRAMMALADDPAALGWHLFGRR